VDEIFDLGLQLKQRLGCSPEPLQQSVRVDPTARPSQEPRGWLGVHNFGGSEMIDEHHADRRSFLKTGAIAGTALVGGASGAIAQLASDTDASNRPLNRGDAAILRFLAAAEIIESDLWLQYNELGGIQDSEVPGGSGSQAYTAALNNLDEDMNQYIHDNTDDEMTHAAFINAYLVSRGARPVNLDPFRTLTGSQATGADKTKKRLTNLMQLTVDTSWWTRYRDSDHNPDLDPSFVFPQAVPSLNSGQHPAIPRTDADLTPANHIQSIANTAAFHFGLIEQGGTSLYPALAQRVSGPNVLRILLSIGPTETMHFQTWQDKAGNAVKPPLAPLTDGSLTFPDLTTAGEEFQPNLIMPEPCPFLRRTFPKCSIIRPVITFGAVKALTGLVASGLFIGQSQAFFNAAMALARAADAATREC
jgi:Ferritin-like domain